MQQDVNADTGNFHYKHHINLPVSCKAVRETAECERADDSD